MEARTAPPGTALQAALARLLRPLVRLMLKSGLPFAAFADVAKRVYVEVAMNDFAIEGKKPTISRASILTGLTRKEVQRLVGEAASGSSEPSPHYNRAARVLTGWIRDRDYRDSRGAPKALPAEGPVSVASLVRRHSGDMPARAVLDELLRVGAVAQRADGKFQPVARAYVPQRGTEEKLQILGSDVADLITTIDHNVEHGDTDPRFQRKVMYHRIPAGAVAEFRALGGVQAQALLETLDTWLAEHDTDPAAGEATARVGIGIYYFEEPAP
jgi:hypothetical protein